MKTIFELRLIDTGYLLVQPQTKDAAEKLKAFHNDTVRDERKKLLEEIVKILGLKHELAVVSRRPQ